MHEIYEVKELLMNELKEYGSKGELTGGSLEVIDKLAHAIKNICKIIEAAEEEEEYSMNSEYSERGGNSYARGGYGGGGGGESYRSSYARGRGRNARRDSRGRYSRESSYRGNSYRGYSRDGKEEYIENLREMMENAPDDQTRQSIQRMIQQMENQ